MATARSHSNWGNPPAFPLAVVWLIRTERESRSLRRFADGPCSAHGGGQYTIHDATVPIGTFPSKLARKYEGDHTRRPPRRSDRRWPKRCACGYRFTATDTWQLAVERLYEYRGPYGHWMVTTRNAPPGSLWDAKWLRGVRAYVGPDGRALEVVCPGGHPWHIDGRARNCTLPKDDVHKCWVRHGDPTNPQGSPPLHVDKNGVTCSAGAGSIIAGKYHGFLHHGHFTAG